MFLIDDILLAPAKGLMWIFKEIHKRVMDEYFNEEAVYKELRRLQYLLDIGEISEKEFDRVENSLLERLQEIKEYNELLEEEEPDES
ncbi:MAG TPA: gas vesicle protein GvpG [Bacillota bacterium]|nr:gas vesicle protein GvpG [Bacillota bacterium]